MKYEKREYYKSFFVYSSQNSSFFTFILELNCASLKMFSSSFIKSGKFLSFSFTYCLITKPKGFLGGQLAIEKSFLHFCF